MTILSILLAFTFVANLPYKFLVTNEQITRIGFKSKNSDTIDQIYNVSDIYEALDFQKYVQEGKIKFKYLSESLNNFLNSPDNNIDKSNIGNDANKKLRINYWSSMGLTQDWLLNNEFKIPNLKIRSMDLKNNANVPNAWVYDSNELNPKYKYTLDVVFDKKVLNLAELKENIEKENDTNLKNIKQDLLDFTNYLISRFVDVQSSFYNYFGDFSFLSSKSSVNLDENFCSSDVPCSIGLNQKAFNSIYNSFFNDLVKSDDLVFIDNSNKDLETFIKSTLNNPVELAMRILENYFISYITTYKNLINKTVVTNDDQWNKYLSERKTFNIYSKINPFYSLWSIYTYHSGYSYDDIWFTPYSDSKILLYDQQNLFLSYTQYNIQINENGSIVPNSYDNYIHPDIYLYTFLGLSVLFLLLSYSKFRKMNIY
ncbi:hypothetical protein [Spiroplasma helicoides]|nr:hypothetical protein [Spiroplasma helicoides]